MTTATPLSGLIKQNWWMFLVSGVISLLLGLALVFWPDITLQVAAWLVGLSILFFGILRLLNSIFGGEAEHRFAQGLVGVLGIALGILVMRNPIETIGVLALIIGIFWIISGLLEAWRGLTNDFPGRWWVVIGGLIAAALGAALVFWPDITVQVIAILVGIYMIIDAIIEVVMAFQIKAA
jgi:uncharacterized membrane protein HdeD (DUF308 family)